MFLEGEFAGSLTFLLILLAFFMGTSPVGVTLFIKLMLYRRRLAEDEASAFRKGRRTLMIEGTLEDFAVALAKEIEKFRRPRRPLAAEG